MKSKVGQAAGARGVRQAPPPAPKQPSLYDGQRAPASARKYREVEFDLDEPPDGFATPPARDPYHTASDPAAAGAAWTAFEDHALRCQAGCHLIEMIAQPRAPGCADGEQLYAAWEKERDR